MLTLVRLITAGIGFVIIFVVLFVGALFIGGAIAGGIAGAKNPENAAKAGEEAGEEFGEKYVSLIALGSVGVAGVSSVALAFAGILPWCRKKTRNENMEDPFRSNQGQL